MNITYKAVEAMTILDCIRKMVESGEYCSDAIKAVLGVAERGNAPFEDDKENA